MTLLQLPSWMASEFAPPLGIALFCPFPAPILTTTLPPSPAPFHTNTHTLCAPDKIPLRGPDHAGSEKNSAAFIVSLLTQTPFPGYLKAQRNSDPLFINGRG